VTPELGAARQWVDAARQDALRVAGIALLMLDGKGDGDAVKLLDEAAESAEQAVRNIQTAQERLREAD
jgi:hypothetical protein